MDVESLKTKQADIESKYNEAGKQIESHQASIKTLNDERLLLQGKYLALQELIDSKESHEDEMKASVAVDKTQKKKG